MKIKGILAAAFASFAVCAGGLCACLPPSDNKGDGVGSEFAEFRDRAVSVLRDNGIEVNDYTSKARTDANMYSAGDRLGSVRDIVLAAEGVTENVDLIADARLDKFEQSFYAGLIIGDGISTYHSEKNFYNIPVYIGLWHQYFSVTKSGDITTVKCYTDRSETTDESYIALNLDYKSEHDYSYTFLMQAESYTIFTYGNSRKEYAEYGIDGAGNGSYAMYAGNEKEGYYVVSRDVATRLDELLKPEHPSIDKTEYAKLKNYKYALTKEQTETVMDKYFKGGNTPGHQEPEAGLKVQDYNGVKVAQYYNASNGESIVEIPDGVDYLDCNFTVFDFGGLNALTLKIPASVKGVVRAKDGEYIEDNGNRYTVYEETDVSDTDIRCVTDDGGEAKGVLFGAVEVDGKNAVYESRGGHLFAKDGTALYLVNSPLVGFKLAYVSAMKEDIAEYYQNLLGAVTVIDATAEELCTAEINNFAEALFGGMTGLETVNFICAGEQTTGNNNYYMPLSAYGDITVNVKLTSTAYTGTVAVNNAAGRELNVTVNIDETVKPADTGATLMHVYDPNGGSTNLFLNLNLSEVEYMTEYSGLVGYDGFKSVKTTFTQSAAADGFIFRRLSGGENAIELAPVKDGATLNVPARFAGLEITVLLLPAAELAGKTVTINMPENDGHDGVRSVLIIERDGSEPNGFSLAELKNENVKIVCPWSYFNELYIESDGHKLAVEYSDCPYFYCYDYDSYERLPQIKVTVNLRRNDLPREFDARIDGDRNRVVITKSDLSYYGEWDDLTLTDAQGNLYPVTRVEGDLIFFLPHITDDLVLDIVGINDVEITIKVDGEGVHTETFDITGGEFWFDEVLDGDARKLYMIIGERETGERRFICDVPAGRTVHLDGTPYDFEWYGNNGGRKDVIELTTVEEQYFTFTVEVDGKQVTNTRVRSGTKIVLPDIEEIIDGENGKKVFVWWVLNGYPVEYTSDINGDRIFNDTTVSAVYEDMRESYTVTFEIEGETSETSLAYGAKITPPAVPDKVTFGDGSTGVFVGWMVMLHNMYYGEYSAEEIKKLTVKGDMTVIAEYVAENGGN